MNVIIRKSIWRYFSQIFNYLPRASGLIGKSAMTLVYFIQYIPMQATINDTLSKNGYISQTLEFVLVF